MTTQTEALKLAIEVFGGGDWHDEIVDTDWADKANNALTVMREALAEQPTEQEPVAWLEPDWGEKICPEVGYEVTMTEDHPRDLCWVPLYPHPAQRTWVGLTDKEVNKLWESTDSDWELMKRTEAKLKEKNT